MYKAIDVANYVIKKSIDIGSPVSNLKLQKILYYIQAAMLVEMGERCFDDKITAWEFGPVVVSVYQIYKEYGRGDIPIQKVQKKMVFDANQMKIITKDNIVTINSKYKKIIDKVIQAYSTVKNPFELVRKTHQEKPWKDTNINDEIDWKAIQQYYLKNPEKIYSW